MIYSIKSVLPNRLDSKTGKPLSITLDLFNPYKNGLAVTSVTNTGPLKANTIMDDWATVPGGRKNTDHISYRNIVMKLTYVGQTSIEELRHLTYKYFPVREDIRLEFTTDSGSYYIDGTIDDNGVPMWTKQESSTVSIMCGDPFFYEINEKSYDFKTIIPLFNFFLPSGRIQATNHGGVLTKVSQQPFPASKIFRKKKITINNPSNQYIGLKINFRATGSVEEPRFVNLTTNEGLYLNGDYVADESYVIDTRPGHKSIIKSDGTNAISKYCVSDGTRKSKWLLLQPGDNDIVFGAKSGDDSMDVKISIRPLYEGI